LLVMARLCILIMSPNTSIAVYSYIDQPFTIFRPHYNHVGGLD